MKRISLFHILCAWTALGVGLVSCAPATAAPLDLTTALAKPTEVASTVATSESAPTPIPATFTPEATATPEASMTMDDWYKILYDGTFTGLVSGKEKPLELIFGPTRTEVLIDSETIRALPVGIPIAVLHPTGLITTPADPVYASEQVKIPGTYILTAIDRTNGATADYVRCAIIAASNAYRAGNTNIRVEFGPITSGHIYYSDPEYIKVSDIYTTTENGKIVTPIFDMPKSFKIGNKPEESQAHTFQEEGLGEPNEADWLNTMINAGFEWIVFYFQ